MKRTILLFVLALSIFMMIGCTNGIDDEKNNPQDENTINIDDKLLEGYPKDILPIYHPISIEDTSFTCRDDVNYVIGKDFYNVSYISNDNIDDISDYYLSLMTNVDEEGEEWFDKYFFSGNINENHVNISLNELTDNSNDVRVSLSIGLDETDYVDENPFFNDYPNDLVDIYRKNVLQEITYSKSYVYKKDTYMIIYQTDMTETDFLEYYKPKYMNMSNFIENKDTYGNKLIWDDRNYNINLIYSTSANYNFVSIYAYLNH